MNESRIIRIRDHRHAEKPKDIKPGDISADEIASYKKEHHMGSHATDDSIRQLIIIEKGGPVYGQEDWDKPLNPNDKTQLTYEGIRQAHDLGSEIYKEVDLSPRGRICMFVASPSGRTVETTELVVDRIEQLIKREKPEHLKLLRVNGLDSSSSLELDEQDSIFIFDQQGVSDIDSFSNDTLEKINKLFGGETIGEMLWYAKPEELQALKEELKIRFPEIDPATIDKISPRDYQVPPEEVVARIVGYYEKLIDLANKQFPNRSIDFYSVSHNMILDATSMRLLGMEISTASVKKLGGEARTSLEAGQIIVDGNSVTIKFRDMENRITLDELRALKAKLLDEAKIRRKQWGE